MCSYPEADAPASVDTHPPFHLDAQEEVAAVEGVSAEIARLCDRLHEMQAVTADLIERHAPERYTAPAYAGFGIVQLFHPVEVAAEGGRPSGHAALKIVAANGVEVVFHMRHAVAVAMAEAFRQSSMAAQEAEEGGRG